MVRWRNWQIAALVVLVVAAAGSLAYGVVVGTADRQVAEADREAAAAAAQEFANPLLELCVRDPDGAASIGVDCEKAARVAAEGPPTLADPPDDGDDGRGIVRTAIAGDRLVVIYTDGERTDVGRVVGEDGADGQDGRDGADGDPGRGIRATDVADGRLVVTYTDGATADLGRVVGSVGAPGRGVVAVTAAEGRLSVAYTDGSVTDAGPLPRGPEGPVGPPGPACPPGFEPVVGSATVGGTTFTRAAMCVDPDSAVEPSPTPAPDDTDGGSP